MKTPEFILGEHVAFFHGGFILSGILHGTWRSEEGHIYYMIEHDGLPYHKTVDKLISKIKYK